MKTITALLLWLLSSVGASGPLCELALPEDPALCDAVQAPAPPPPEEEEQSNVVQPEDLTSAHRHHATKNGSRISNGF